MTDKEPPKDEDKPREHQIAAPDPEPKQAPNQKYIFKILPADPKNSFDFEDVADK